jgi:regulation of enolase protein 1 (concanavalin A-like superfamily)
MMFAAGGQTDPNADVHYPAADANVYAISAVNAQDQLSNIVNRGPGIDLLAPGGGYPILLKGGGFSTSFEATSYSVPFASATAALIKQMYSGFTGAQIMSIMKDSGVNVKDMSTQFTNSGLTYKRLNVWEALKLAEDRTPTTAPQSPYTGTPFAAAQTVQAENFDNGGEGVAYHDTDSSNAFTKYRTTGVDIGNSTDSGSSPYVGNTRVGEWLEYSFKLKKTSTYDLNLRLAMLGKGARIHMEWDGVDKTGLIAVANTGGWQNWKTITHNAISLGSGNHTLRLYIDKGNGSGDGPNINWFSLTPAGSYTSANIGNPAVVGSTTTVSANSAYDITAGGAGIGSTSDQFRFLYKQITGDFDIKVRVESLSLSSVWAKAGLMARESLNSNSRNVFAFATPGSNGYKFQTRSTTGGATAIGGKGGVSYPNVWLRLKRVGNTFYAYRGTNGSTWTQYASTTMALPTTVFVGTAATSTYAKGATIAKFRNLA